MHDSDRVYIGCEPAGRLTPAFEALCVLAAVVLLVANLVRLASTVGLQWWVPVVALSAGFAADLATGWCNAALTAGDAFRRLERVVTRWTGLVPRADDEAFAQTGQTAGQAAGQVGPRVRP